MKGKLIAIEGLDGSGKATQSQALCQAIQEMGLPVRRITFPDYESDSSALVRMYLAGKFGSSAQDVSAYAASAFFAVDRFASYRTDWGSFYQQGGILIADRYTTSNAIHQCSKLPRQEWPAFLDWLFDHEYNRLGIPAPDRVIYLRVDPEVSQQLMSQRYHNNETKKDIHERDVDYLKQSRQAADYCAHTLGWITVECCENQAMRSIESIQRDVLAAVKEILC